MKQKNVSQNVSIKENKEIIRYDSARFMYFSFIKDFPNAQKVLEEMKLNRKFLLSDNFNFMKKMPDHYLGQKPIYLQADQFQDQPIMPPIDSPKERLNPTIIQMGLDKFLIPGLLSIDKVIDHCQVQKQGKKTKGHITVDKN